MLCTILKSCVVVCPLSTVKCSGLFILLVYGSCFPLSSLSSRCIRIFYNSCRKVYTSGLSIMDTTKVKHKSAINIYEQIVVTSKIKYHMLIFATIILNFAIYRLEKVTIAIVSELIICIIFLYSEYRLIVSVLRYIFKFLSTRIVQIVINYLCTIELIVWDKIASFKIVSFLFRSQWSH